MAGIYRKNKIGFHCRDLNMKTLATHFEADITKMMASKGWVIYSTEEKIDSSKPLYLLTWVPDPKELPDVSFDIQHAYCVDTIIQYCSYCSNAAFCVETTQKGNPHYHGWYQCSSDPELASLRIAAVKTMIRFGSVDIDKGSHYRKNSYTSKNNALHYYKKDLHGEMLLARPNPITAETPRPELDRVLFAMYFKTAKRATASQILDKVVQKDLTLKFYLKSSKGIDTDAIPK